MTTHDKEKRLIDAVARFPDGAAISDIEDDFDVSRRTLQRRLSALVDEGQLHREGKGRATRYVVPEQVPEVADDEGADSEPASAPLEYSPDAQEALHTIRRPLSERAPVSYRASFLEAYEPGRTHYLSAETRATLLEVGSTPDRELPAGTYARRILDRLLIDLSWNSSRLEGNTYSLLETERLLEADIEAQERDPLETQMILNHKSAIEFLVENAKSLGFRRHVVLNLHALLSENLLGDPSAEGRLRNRPVGIRGSVYQPLANPHQIEAHFDTILEKGEAIDDPFEHAFFALVHLPYLQPFLDANKRVSRLAANIPFIRQNLTPLSFVEVTSQQYTNAMLAVYEQNDVAILRDLFVWAYKRSAAQYQAIRESLGEPDTYRLKRRRELKETVGRVVRQAMARDEARREVEQRADALPDEESDRFVDIVWEELEHIHEGNIAKYRITPSEFELWERGWRGE